MALALYTCNLKNTNFVFSFEYDICVSLYVSFLYSTLLITFLLFQMFPVALVCGNTYIFKPSERVPGATMMLVEMLKEAGCPNGVVNVIHGQHDAVNFICDNPDIRAISFVGSDQAVSNIIRFCKLLLRLWFAIDFIYIIT